MLELKCYTGALISKVAEEAIFGRKEAIKQHAVNKDGE